VKIYLYSSICFDGVLLIIDNSIDTKNSSEDNVMAEVKEFGVSWYMDWVWHTPCRFINAPHKYGLF
jgi:hypothetical protein